ncbi:phosphopantothenoylcysteine decarboxylase domain-containing protein [Methylacidiphilum caldifontis]|uniref:Phosphopantothenoylcysteine synthase n=1 Tax=Methylacidiphilum caldifontis TaxID=2795386 RepID=A0A4Y8P8B1_9BACT|nr:phosphopantothenoylcysteine decarboxylase [Methylacidiphilum caldifontis]TFE66853.1 phosphopantothenoylcysteine synthase [Methylacidiphilum caldifontis]
MKVLITCGPSFEPIDQVRRITNFSTGKLGIELSSYFSKWGMEVVCLLGSHSSLRPISPQFTLYLFDTNEGLWKEIKKLSESHSFDAIFHAAALCDFRVQQIVDQYGEEAIKTKITSDREYWIKVVPAEKLIDKLRTIFPDALIAGWKYEVEADYDTVLLKGKRQIERSGSDYCVINGPAYGLGYGILNREGELFHVPSVEKIGDFFLPKISLRNKRLDELPPFHLGD